MDDVTSTKLDRVPRGLVGMLALLAAVETGLASCDVATTTHLIESWTDARAMATSAEVRASGVLCLGDSQIKQGLLPSAFAGHASGPAYNLAVHGGQPASAYFLLRRALDAGARPKAVVVGFFPGLLGSDLRINARQWPEVVGPAEALDLALTARDVELGTRTGLGLALRSFRSRDQLRRSIVWAVRGEPDPAVGAILGDRRLRRGDRGGIALAANPSFADDPGPPVAPSTAGLSWRPKPENARFLRRLLDLARDRGIAVYWVTTTLSPASQAIRERLGLHEGYVRYLRGLQADYPNLTVLDTLGLGFDRTAFHDPCHLDGPSAGRLSAAVARAIGPDERPGSRWVRLLPEGDRTRIARGHADAGVGR